MQVRTPPGPGGKICLQARATHQTHVVEIVFQWNQRKSKNGAHAQGATLPPGRSAASAPDVGTRITPPDVDI